MPNNHKSNYTVTLLYHLIYYMAGGLEYGKERMELDFYIKD